MRARIARQDAATVSPWKSVCVGVFVGDEDVSREVYGASRWRDALAAVRRLQREGIPARAEWLNIGPWCAELWVSDLSRPFGSQPERFYGRLATAVQVGQAA